MEFNKEKNYIYHGDNLEFMQSLPDGCVSLCYTDAPYNSGITQTRKTLKMTRKEGVSSDAGMTSANYNIEVVGEMSYPDKFDDFHGFIRPRLEEGYRLLAPNGTMFVHLDYREVHYVKIMMDEIFGRENFLNELIIASDWGSKPKNRWPSKHQTILVYVKDLKNYTFNYDAIDRIPYQAPEMAGKKKATKGKVPTDVWNFFLSPMSKEKTGYPTQKPLALLNRIINVHTNAGDTVFDMFAGSGTTGESAYELGRKFILADQNDQAIEVMKKRFCKIPVEFV